MRAKTWAAGVCVLLAGVGLARGADLDKAEKEAVEKVLQFTTVQLTDKVAEDEPAVKALKGLAKPTDKEILRMAKDLKSHFDVKELDADGVKKIEAAIKKAVKDADADKLKVVVVKKDPTLLPKEESRKFCWLWGCP